MHKVINNLENRIGNYLHFVSKNLLKKAGNSMYQNKKRKDICNS